MIFSTAYPPWFLGIDSIFEVLFFLVTLIIAWRALKYYRISGERRFLWWGIGFLSISGAYAVTAFANYYLFGRIEGVVASPVPSMIDFSWLHFLGHITYTGLFLAGYLLLALIVLDFEDTRLITLFGFLVAILALAIVLGKLPWLLTLALVILLVHILLYQYLTLPKGRTPRARKLVIGGFAFLLLEQIAYLLLPLLGIAYVIGHLMGLVGFGLITIMFLTIR